MGECLDKKGYKAHTGPLAKIVRANTQAGILDINLKSSSDQCLILCCVVGHDLAGKCAAKVPQVKLQCNINNYKS